MGTKSHDGEGVRNRLSACAGAPEPECRASACGRAGRLHAGTGSVCCSHFDCGASRRPARGDVRPRLWRGGRCRPVSVHRLRVHGWLSGREDWEPVLPGELADEYYVDLFEEIAKAPETEEAVEEVEDAVAVAGKE